MKNKISGCRIKALLRYDWINFRKNLLWIFVVLEAFMFAEWGYDCWSKSLFELPYLSYVNTVLPAIGSLWGITNLALLIWMTKFLHRKYNHRNESIPFVMLPANTSEKALETHLFYLIGFAVSFVLMLANIGMLIGIPMMTMPDGAADIQLAWPQIWADAVWLKPMLYVSILIFLGYIGAYITYLNYNLLFQKNPQPKSILLMMATIGLYGYYLDKLIRNKWLYIKELGGFDYWELNLLIVLVLIPVIGLFYSFYYQLKEKQIK